MAYLYKYRDFANPYHRRLLTHGELRFTPPIEFNDPHDCQIPIQWDKSDPEWLRSEIREFESKQNAEEDEEIREQRIQEQVDLCLNSLSQRTLLEYQTRKIISPKVGVLSFSLDSAHPLMWAHYANSHKGFLVGFDQKKLLDFIRDISGIALNVESAPASPGLEIRPVKVEYPDKMPVLIPRSENEAEIVRTVVTTKSSEWEYENEVRYLLSKFDESLSLVPLEESERIVTLPPGVITEVTIGANASQFDLHGVAYTLSGKKPRVRLYKAVPSFGSFGLDRIEVDY